MMSFHTIAEKSCHAVGVPYRGGGGECRGEEEGGAVRGGEVGTCYASFANREL